MKQDVTISWQHKDAKKLLAAIEKGVYDKLTPREADEIAEFAFNLRCAVMDGEG